MPRTDLTEIPMLVTIRCGHCDADRNLVRWYPRRNWKKYAEVDIFVCKVCHGYGKFKKAKQVSYTLKADAESIYLDVKGSTTALKGEYLLKLFGNELFLNIDTVSGVSFSGKLHICNLAGRYLVTFIYGPKGLQHIEIDSELMSKYGAIIDDIEKVKKKMGPPRLRLSTRRPSVRRVNGEITLPTEVVSERAIRIGEEEDRPRDER